MNIMVDWLSNLIRNTRIRTGASARQLLRDGVRYVMGGGLAAVLDYTVYILLMRWTEASPPLAQAVSRAMGGIVSFLAHRFWTFRYRTGPAMWGPLYRFWIVWGAAYLLAIAAVALFAHALPGRPLIAKVLADGIVTAIVFFLQRHWTFRARVGRNDMCEPMPHRQTRGGEQ